MFSVFSLLYAGTLLLLASPARAEIPSFPGAEGFGAAAEGGRGGDVYHVTSLGDDGTVGTLRYGIEHAPSEGRTIVFDVGGWITLNSKLGVTRSRITIAGQTAPGGVGVRGGQFSVGGDHVIVRHMRFRPGRDAGRVDSVNVNSNARYVIFDHVSAGFSYDENFSVQASDLTLQYSAVAYGLVDHSAGSLIEGASNLSFHHNLYAHNQTRNPKARSSVIDWVNNIVYDYHNGFIAGDSLSEDVFWTANVDGNTFITDAGRPMITGGREWNYGLWFGANAYDGDTDGRHDPVVYNRSDVVGGRLQHIVSSSYTWADTPYDTPALWKDATPQDAYERVLAQFGATPWSRDEVDQLLHDNVVNRAGSRIRDESDLPLSNDGYPTLGGAAPHADADRDGMADGWEMAHGLDPHAADHNGDFDDDGYTNLEEYLNDLAAFPAPGVIRFASGGGRYADSSGWTHRWQPSRFDRVAIDGGVVVVDAVGQRAGALTVAAGAGDAAELRIEDGWLRVEDRLVIGGEAGAQGTLTLAGGELYAASIAKGADGEFAFTGGVLRVETVEFSLVNDGGVLAPGRSIGEMHVLGDVTLRDGVLAIELDGEAADLLQVDGVLALGGALDVTVLGEGMAEHGRWLIARAARVEGAFTSISEGYGVEVDGGEVYLVAPEPGALGMGVLAAPLVLRRRSVQLPARLRRR